LVQWFLNETEIYRLVPGAPREFRRLVFNQETVSVDLQSSKVKSTRSGYNRVTQSF
jgi:hypothetical protein